MFTYQGLYWLHLPLEVVKQLSVAGKHAATCGTSHKSLLSVAPHVFPQPVPDLEEGIAPRPAAKERLLLGKRLLLCTFYVIVHVAVEPLWIIKGAIAMLPLANVSLRALWH